MEHFDVAVVGAGPAGSSAALFAARGGARTLLLDRRPELGQPVQCGEFLPTLEELCDLFPNHGGFEEVFQVPETSVLQRTREMACVSPWGGRFTFPVDGYSVSRRSFDKVLALRAEAAGAELRFPKSVVGVKEAGSELLLPGGDRVAAKVVIAADGPLTEVGRAVGFHVERQMYRMITATCDLAFPDRLELFFGSLAPGGYAWIIPKGGDCNVGLGATHLPPGESLSSLLATFARRYHLPAPHHLTRWWVPLGPPPASAVRGSVLFAGDAANLVMATNGGGIPTAMVSGMDAGKAAVSHLREGKPLEDYDRRWREHMYEPLMRGWRMKEGADRWIEHDLLVALGMRYLGSHGLDEMIRLRWPRRWPHSRSAA
ncbi:MAG: NAD(P)/FAD-dependent oxidoreductase [Euryarchaeota archaeon]|nr:NAD(P)/FAD-dependent oxidoreductase [Euryarchaeota archaeon]MDE1835216.1 NAD(P)/FAD-dependent oxidoreductase [Euryarchaeota archaeon]MDE1880073.1 NAD(P)/FAD-dependent oxidoreductase [Euryarchaeota archaeon]MDE2043512.1 NAD(P)/FAD-dependent oxidoreductase [Thermoplasmata archaeon]